MKSISIKTITLFSGFFLLYLVFQFGCTKHKTDTKINTNLTQNSNKTLSSIDDPHRNSIEQQKNSHAEVVIKPKALALDEALRNKNLNPIPGKINDQRIMNGSSNSEETSRLIKGLNPEQHLLLNYVTNSASYYFALNNRCPADVQELIKQGFIPFKSSLNDIEAINPILINMGWFIKSESIVKYQEIIETLRENKHFTPEQIAKAFPLILFNNVGGNLFSEYINNSGNSFQPTFNSFVTFLDNLGGANKAFFDCFMQGEKAPSVTGFYEHSSNDNQWLNEIMFGSVFHKNGVLMIYTLGTEESIRTYKYSPRLIDKVVKINYFIIRFE